MIYLWFDQGCFQYVCKISKLKTLNIIKIDFLGRLVKSRKPSEICKYFFKKQMIQKKGFVVWLKQVAVHPQMNNIR